jgi:hypothetical protein
MKEGYYVWNKLLYACLWGKTHYQMNNTFKENNNRKRKVYFKLGLYEPSGKQ